MNSKDYRKIGGSIFLILFLLACVSSGSGTPASTPVPEAKIRKTLEAIVIETAAAAQTQTTTARPPTLTPTITRTPSQTPTQPTPSPTFFYSLFTATLTFDIQVEATDASLNATAQYLNSIGAVDVGGGDIRIINRMWACYVRYSPNLQVHPGYEFYGGWEIMNIGSEPWASTTVDFIYKGGYRHEGTRIQDLHSTVGSGKLLIIGATFIAPKRVGSYHAHYILQVGNNAFCPMWMDFNVVK